MARERENSANKATYEQMTIRSCEDRCDGEQRAGDCARNSERKMSAVHREEYELHIGRTALAMYPQHRAHKMTYDKGLPGQNRNRNEMTLATTMALELYYTNRARSTCVLPRYPLTKHNEGISDIV
jgi:hypothetical protein